MKFTTRLKPFFRFGGIVPLQMELIYCSSVTDRAELGNKIFGSTKTRVSENTIHGWSGLYLLSDENMKHKQLRNLLLMKTIKLSLVLFFFSCSINAQEWKTVGTGMTNQFQLSSIGIRRFYSDTINHVLYAGGSFIHAGGIVVKNIAKWDGVNWFALGTGVNFVVNALTVYNNDVYVGGISQNKVWKWNGTTWSSLPSFNGGVYVLSVVNGELYAGGNFTYQGFKPMNGIARWTGTAWDSLKSGVGGCLCSSSVQAIIGYQGKLVAAGLFWEAGNIPAKNIAMWDGTNWEQFYSGLYGTDPYNDEVFSLGTDGANLYAGGMFSNAGNDTAHYFAKWNGTIWSHLGNTLNGAPGCIGFYNQNLWRNGSLNFDTTYYRTIAYFKDSIWEFFGNEFIGGIGDFAIFNGELYVGCGGTGGTSGIAFNYVARMSILQFQTQVETCNNTCDGTATVTSVGVLPNVFLWSNGATTQTITGLCAGVYSVTITDSTGSLSFGSIEVGSNSDLTFIDSISDASCFICVDGYINLGISGGIGAIDLLWSNGDTINTISNLSFGNYVVTVTDSMGCTITDTFLVNYINSIQTQTTDVNCFSECTGSANAVSNGVAPFIYQWSNGSTTQSENGLCANTYYVTVTDSNGVAAFDTITITEPDPIVIIDTSTNASCSTCSNGSATINASGGVGTLTVLWSNGATTSTIDNQLPGTYTVVITDSNGCMVNDTVTIGFDVGVSGLQNADYKLQIYPNPANETVTVMLRQAQHDIQEIVISNLLGEVVQSLKYKVQRPSVTIDINNLPQGIYLLHVQTTNGWRVGKVVKE